LSYFGLGDGGQAKQLRGAHSEQDEEWEDAVGGL